MIFYWFIICALVAIATALVMWIFRCGRFVPLQHVLVWSLAGALLFGLFSAGFSSNMRDELATLQNEYNDLMVYYDIVNNSTDEIVRYDYYTDVLDYNERCRRLQEDNKSFWIGCFMTDEEMETLPTIDFLSAAGCLQHLSWGGLISMIVDESRIGQEKDKIEWRVEPVQSSIDFADTTDADWRDISDDADNYCDD